MRFTLSRITVALTLFFAPWPLVGQEVQTGRDWAQLAARAHPLDLETRALLAVQAMQNTIGPEQRVPWIMAYLTPSFRFDVPTAMLAGEYLDGLIMARIVTGSHDGDESEEMMRHAVLHSLVDGLSSGTIEGALGVKAEKKRSVELAGHKHLLPSLLTLFRLNPNEQRPIELVRESLRKFREIAKQGQLADGRKYVYFPVAPAVSDPGAFSYIAYDREKGWEGLTREPIDTGSAGFQGAVTLPFAQYYQLTRDPEAAEFLDQFIRFLRERATDFNDDGSFTKRDVTNGQVWSRLMTTEGILIYGLASGNADLVAWARSVFDKLQELHASRFGWIPENLAFNHGLGCETDAMTACLETAFLLARFVDDAYWEAAERIAMNQLLQQQILEVDPLGDAAALLGGFASFGAPNDWFVPEGPYLTQSCHGSGMRSLYNVWYHSAWWEEAGAVPTLRVNLHWSKNLPGAQIISHLPRSTALEIRVDRPCQVVVRKPDWAALDAIRADATLQGAVSQSITPELKGRWLHLGRFDQPTKIRLRLPDDVVTHTDVIHDYAKKADLRFTTRWRGNLVLSITPAGERRPNYARRSDDASEPYIARCTATVALDPISMTPPHSTETPRPADTIQRFQSVSSSE